MLGDYATASDHVPAMLSSKQPKNYLVYPNQLPNCATLKTTKPRLNFKNPCHTEYMATKASVLVKVFGKDLPYIHPPLCSICCSVDTRPIFPIYELKPLSRLISTPISLSIVTSKYTCKSTCTAHFCGHCWTETGMLPAR